MEKLIFKRVFGGKQIEEEKNEKVEKVEKDEKYNSEDKEIDTEKDSDDKGSH